MEEAAFWDWRTKGRCNTLSPQQADKLFFPESGRSINKAKAFCLGCPVATECLEYALETSQYGIWAGTSGEERRQILKFRNQLVGQVTAKKIVQRKNFVFS